MTEPITGYSDEKPLLDCRDGHRAELVAKNDGSIAVYLEKIAQGEAVVEPLQVSSAAVGDWQKTAEVRRERQLLVAMCRFINAGGSLDGLQEAAKMIDTFVSTGPQLSLPEDWRLLDVIEEGTHQMLLLDDEDMVTIVTEDEWIDRVPLEHLAGRVPDLPVEPYQDDHPSL